MAKWDVCMPVAGYVTFKDVAADSEEEAIAACLNRDFEKEDVEDLQLYEHLVEGNVVQVDNPDAFADEVESDDDDPSDDCDGNCAACDEDDCDDRDADYEGEY